jgi:hypothetical protein
LRKMTPDQQRRRNSNQYHYCNNDDSFHKDACRLTIQS